jgi:hypothetical protein
MKYTLINDNDCRDTIEIETHMDEDPQAVALEVLGWHLLPTVDPDEHQIKLAL